MYYLFAGCTYYPCGGVNDFVGTFDTVLGAVKHMANTEGFDWWHVTDSNMRIVHESS